MTEKNKGIESNYPGEGWVNDKAEMVFLNKRDINRGFGKMKLGVLLGGGGMMLSIGGLGVVGIPMAIVGGWLFARGIDQGILRSADRRRDMGGE